MGTILKIQQGVLGYKEILQQNYMLIRLTKIQIINSIQQKISKFRKACSKFNFLKQINIAKQINNQSVYFKFDFNFFNIFSHRNILALLKKDFFNYQAIFYLKILYQLIFSKKNEQKKKKKKKKNLL
eukprot:TRINITY_DN31755_c0_g1_i1.p2 TRINITY_DN31755_c0_g1~~TRINITY_DN31755_c0_g1_i1.p2  ORF type:complete len:127 (+),score=5.46 TRINITY_DN31755_c0_g1_i1:1-381(+)